MKYLLLGLMLTSTAYATKNDLHFEIDNSTASMYDKPYKDTQQMRVFNITYEHEYPNRIYTTIGMSMGHGETEIKHSEHFLVSYERKSNTYSAVKFGIGFRF